MLVGGVNPTGRVNLSQSEIEYITHGVSDDCRADGRGRLDWRNVSVELNPVPQAAGSARVQIGGTDVLVSIKGDIGRPTLENPNEGQVICTVDSSTVFSMNAASTGTNEERLTSDRNDELTNILEDIFINSDIIDRKKLCLVGGKHCWLIYVDVLVLDYDGNLIDTMVMACKLALSTTKLPQVRIEEGGESSEIFLEDKFDESRTFDLVNLPTTVTIGMVGNGYIIDPSASEENCCNSALLFSLQSNGKVCSVRKLGTGLIDPGLLNEYLSVAQDSASILEKLSLSSSSNSHP